MKEFFNDIRDDRITRSSFIASLAIIVLSVIYILFYYTNLHPYIPLYNQLPWGEQRLAQTSGILIPSLLAFIIFGISVILLPRPSSEGVQLERTQSIYGRFRSYEQGLTILKTNPLFGIGFNNYCYARQIILGTNDLASHACSGSDSSVLDI